MRLSLRQWVIISSLFCIPFGPPAEAQEAATSKMQPITLVELVLKDGSRLFGTVDRETGSEVVFRTHAGVVLTLDRDDIASLRTVAGTVRGAEFLPPDPNTTRLFFGPTGRSLKRGQSYLGVYEFMAPIFQIGVTDRLSIGGGTPLIFGIDEWDRPFWITPKLQVYSGHDTHVAVGVLHAFDSDNDGGGVAYGVVTRGTDLRSFTAGAGLAYSSDGGRAALVMIGGEGRIARRVKAVTENYVWSGGRGIATAGFRFFGERLSADLALAVPIGAEDLVAFPLINFVYSF